jgi:hypothetical protein
MKLVISLLLVLSILASTAVTGSKSSAGPVSGQNPNSQRASESFYKAKYKHKIPRNAVPGSTLERRAAWENLTPDQKQRLIAKIKPQMAQAKLIASKMEDPGEGEDLKPSLIDQRGNRRSETWRRQKKGDLPQLRLAEKAASSGPVPKAAIAASWKAPAQNSTLRNHASWFQSDADGDGFTETFENTLADEFTPFYHISTNEPNHFARFGDFLPQTVIQTVSPYTPISHFRVTPLGFGANNTIAYIRIDYWTLWDQDGGFDYDFFCQLNVALGSDYLSASIVDILDLVILLNSSHNLDNERSAILVGAPVANPNNPTFSTDPTAYNAHAFFLSAHETEPGDNSVPLYPVTPIPPFSHIELALARSKHATYTFDPNNPNFPDGLPLMPWSVIFASYASIDALFFLGVICLAEYLALQYALDVMFFSCVVERFGDSGGTIAPTRINIGEVNNPLNASHFIQGGELFTKMTTPIPRNFWAGFVP